MLDRWPSPLDCLCLLPSAKMLPVPLLSARSRPFMSTLPETDTPAPSTPRIARISSNVLLPDPDAPIKAVIWPGSARPCTPRSECVGPEGVWRRQPRPFHSRHTCGIIGQRNYAPANIENAHKCSYNSCTRQCLDIHTDCWPALASRNNSTHAGLKISASRSGSSLPSGKSCAPSSASLASATSPHANSDVPARTFVQHDAGAVLDSCLMPWLHAPPQMEEASLDQSHAQKACMLQEAVEASL
eukprot:364397-Chlamydomonas_euryale.AAC.20